MRSRKSAGCARETPRRFARISTDERSSPCRRKCRRLAVALLERPPTCASRKRAGVSTARLRRSKRRCFRPCRDGSFGSQSAALTVSSRPAKVWSVRPGCVSRHRRQPHKYHVDSSLRAIGGDLQYQQTVAHPRSVGALAARQGLPRRWLRSTSRWDFCAKRASRY